MSLMALTPPQDITWTRMAFARDMIDTNFNDFAFSPKWRSSLAVFYYIVPDEETADTYPNSRIVYLKLTASITGWNPSEALVDVRRGSEAGTWDDLQRTLWEVIAASGWADQYWPCLGAIMQLAVYPNPAAGVAPDDYPYIMDFEPKRRELFEQATATSEVLSGSETAVSTTKGSTNTQSVDVAGKGSIMGIGVEASAKASWQQMDTTTTDTSREKRETLSHSTSFSQMYQLFNGYHIGTNRALFAISPRPHTMSGGEQTESNLINGARRLEGLQDVFLIVHLPKSLGGFCIQAGLDTGHQVTVSVPQYRVVYAAVNPNPGEHAVGGSGSGDDDDEDDPATPMNELIVTRRTIQSCGTFDDNGDFHLEQVREPRPPIVVGEIVVPDRPTVMFRSTTAEGDDRHRRVEVTNNLNAVQSRINRAMLDVTSSSTYQPRTFVETNVFKSLAAGAATAIDVPVSDLVASDYLTPDVEARLTERRITTVGQLFSRPLEEGPDDPDGAAIRDKILRALLSRRT